MLENYHKYLIALSWIDRLRDDHALLVNSPPEGVHKAVVKAVKDGIESMIQDLQEQARKYAEGEQTYDQE